MIAKAVAKYLRVSPRKVRLIAPLIKKKYVDEALAILNSTNKKSAGLLIKVLNSAIANARRFPNTQSHDLYISGILISGGPALKRYKARALGRATMIKHRTTHITVELDMKKPRLPKPVPREKGAKGVEGIKKKFVKNTPKTKSAKTPGSAGRSKE